MITLNGRDYKLLLLDTNILIEIIRNQNNELKNFWRWFNSERYIICFSIFTILELKKSSSVYQQFLDLFSIIPCAILKSHEQLLADEVNVYPLCDEINPILVAAPGRTISKNSIKDVLDLAFSNKQISSDENRWNSAREEIVNGIVSLVRNFPPKNEKYSKKEIREFIQLAGFQQIALRQMKFAKSIVDSNKAVEIDAFPSIKMTTFVVFYKFYVDQRKHLVSDAFDILIFSVLPYVDTIITESHFANTIKKIKSQDKFIKHVDTYTIKHLRNLT